MGLSTAERNRRKRERKKRAKEQEKKRLAAEQEAAAKQAAAPEEEEDVDIEIEYVPEPLLTESEEKNNSQQDDNGMAAVLRRFQARALALVSDVEEEDVDKKQETETQEEEEEEEQLSKRKLRELSRPTVAGLKNRVERSDLVEAHDVTAKDPDFLLFLKAVPSTVPVPRHWGRKRKYLQGKRGIEKVPFALPDFIAKTGIMEVRSAIDEDESNEKARQKNRSRVAPKMGALDVDYRTLYDAFFKHQNKASIQEKLTCFGDLYYEGKEFETQKSSDIEVGGPLSEKLRDALGMTAENSPPPWLINMQRYGPPPSYPNLKIPGLNAPLPMGCSYGYHLNGWGKPPVDQLGRPLFGGNPFDPPNATADTTSGWDFDDSGAIVTSDGKTIGKKPWGALPFGLGSDDEESSSEEESSDDESMNESSDEEGKEKEDSGDEEEEDDTAKVPEDGTQSVVPGSAVDLRKPDGEETPAPSKQLYTVLHETSANKDQQAGAVFASETKYVVPGTNIPEGAQSVLAKAPMNGSGKRKRNDDGDDDDDNEDLTKKFKF